MCPNLADTLAISFEEDPPGAANPVEYVELSKDGFEISRLSGLHGRQFFLAFGFSLGVHAVLALIVLASFSFMRPSIHESPFITVTMLALDGSGGGPEGARGGSGGASAGNSAQPGLSPSPGLGGAGSDPAQPALPEAGQAEETVKKKSEISPKIRFQRNTEPKKPPKLHLQKAAAKTAPPVETQANSAADTGKSLSMTSSSAPGGGIGGPGKPNLGSGGLSSGLGTGLGDGGSGRGGGGSGEFALKQVDTPPVPIRKVEPEFPSEALKMGISGRVVLRFLVKTDGMVAKAFVIEADPRGFFEQSAMEAIDKWRFKPGRYRGNAVDTWVELPIHYRLSR